MPAIADRGTSGTRATVTRGPSFPPVPLPDDERPLPPPTFEALLASCVPVLGRRSRTLLPRASRGHLCPEDLVQDVLLMTCRRAPYIRPDATAGLLPYLHRALTNRARTERRRVRRTCTPVDWFVPIHADRSAETPLDAALARERRRRLRMAFATLSPRARRLIEARYTDGLSWHEVASLLGLPSPDAARLATSRSVARLATALRLQDGRAGHQAAPRGAPSPRSLEFERAGRTERLDHQ